MDHMRFKANLTAATYVSHGLDESAQEDFELHLMSCPECIDDVEAWRAIEKYMPREGRAAAANAEPKRPALRRWRLAASLIGIGIVGAAAGWYGRASSDPGLDRMAFFNALPLTRGAECMPLKFAPDTQQIVLRVAGVARDRKVVALDSGAQELAPSAYGARRQIDGSWLLQFAAATLARGAVHLESRGENGAGEPLGCVSTQSGP